MINLDRDLLQQVRTKYQQGRDRELLPRSLSFDEDKLVSSKLTAQDRLLINKFENARARGVLAARRKDLAKAKELFAAARFLLDTNLLSEEGRLVYESYMEQGESFLDCRYGNFERARQRIFHSLAIDLELEDVYGHEDLVLHRIQQVHNLARIEAYDSQTKRAIQLTVEILAYLDGKLDTLSVPGVWGYDRIARQPSSDVAMMFLQVAGEIALIMAGLNCHDAGELFTSAAEEMLMLTDRQSCYPLVYSWLSIKLDYSRGDINSFLHRTADFISQRYADMELLYYSTLIDSIAVCDRLNTTAANQLKAEIINDVMSNPNSVHPRFVPFFQVSDLYQVA